MNKFLPFIASFFLSSAVHANKCPSAESVTDAFRKLSQNTLMENTLGKKKSNVVLERFFTLDLKEQREKKFTYCDYMIGGKLIYTAKLKN